jgi:LmbE family N-acetylglucosaminyl deacetylase
MATVVFVHAHPDDEAIATAGTMAGLAEAGHRVVLVTATGGELGEVPDGFLADGETLAERRALELAEAARVLGVARLEWLGYHDSGMEGEPSNREPGCFAMADVDEAAARLAAILQEESAEAVVAYDEHGGYGHPDHVQVHRVGVRAGQLAGTPRVYMATQDRDYLRSLRSEAADSEWAPSDEMAEGMETMGEPATRISTEVDVTPWLEAKRQAMRAHRSQIADDSFFLAMPDDVFEMVWSKEWYIQVTPPVPDPFEGPRRTGLLDRGPAGGAG